MLLHRKLLLFMRRSPTHSSGLPVALTAPEAVWELSLSVWLLVKGFRPSPILTDSPVPSPGG
jgi:hypothetical protein